MTVPSPEGGAPRRAGKIWGPGAPGRRLPVRITYAREIPGRLVFLGAALLFILAYMRVMRDTPGRATAFGEDTAAATSESGSGAKPPAGHGAFQGLLDAAKDGEGLDALDTAKPTDPYRTLMWNLKRYSVAEVSSIAVTVGARDLINEPAGWRGQPVRVVGQVVRTPELQRLGKNEAGYEYRWRGFVVDADDGNAIVFDVFDKPEHDFDRTDLVAVEGVFLQLVTYEARGGTKLVPFIEAKSIKPFVGDRAASFASSPTTLLLAAALVLAAIPFLGYLVSSYFSRRHESELVKALENARQRRSVNLAAASKKPAGAAAPPAPSAPLATSDAPVAPSGPTGTVASGPIAPETPPAAPDAAPPPAAPPTA